MKIAAFNSTGECGCMADTVPELVELLVDQGANLADQTYYYVDNTNPLELSVTHAKPSKP